MALLQTISPSTTEMPFTQVGLDSSSETFTPSNLPPEVRTFAPQVAPPRMRKKRRGDNLGFSSPCEYCQLWFSSFTSLFKPFDLFDLKKTSFRYLGQFYQIVPSRFNGKHVHNPKMGVHNPQGHKQWKTGPYFHYVRGSSSTSSSTIVRFSAEKEMAMSVMRFPERAYLPA